MKRYFYSILFGAALLCPSVHAQTLKARADVPFSFRIGEAVMPAGQYIVDETGHVLRVHEINGHGTAFHLTFPSSRATVSPDYKLEFTRYGDEYYLANLWTGGSREGFALPKSKREKEVAKQFRVVEIAGVTLRQPSR